MMLRKLLCVFALIIIANTNYAQVTGCKDPAANNYNSSATVNDGSCTYNTVNYTPPLKVDSLNSLLQENSGLVWAANSLWTVNDGGGAAVVYRIDTLTNAILQTITLGSATNIDWEDLAFDGTYFYVGDFGNNATGIRTDLKIYKFLLSAIPTNYTTNPTVTIPSAQVEIINFSYSDQTDFTTATSNNTKFDCEAMIVDGGQIHLFSKNWVDVNTTHYVISSMAAGTYTATPLEVLATGYLVTAADKAPGTTVVALLGYQNGFPGNHYLHLLSDFSGGLYFNGNKRRIDLPNAGIMGQGEGLVFRTAQYGYISNERITYSGFTVTQKLRSFNTENFVPAYVLPLDLLQFTATTQGNATNLTWQFAAPVNGLQVLHSLGGSSFEVIETKSSSINGRFIHQSAAGQQCYRLSWQATGGGTRFSPIVCVNGKPEAGISNLVLHRTGELSFTAVVDQPTDYQFNLLSLDGKLLAQTVKRISSGFQTVKFAIIPLDALKIVQLVAGQKTESKLVMPQRN